MIFRDSTSIARPQVFREETGRIDMPELISALSYALDLTEGAVPGHALRSCVLGMRIGAKAGLSQAELSDLYYALLLKDIGQTSNAAHMSGIVDGQSHIHLAQNRRENWRGLHATTRLGITPRESIRRSLLAEQRAIADIGLASSNEPFDLLARIGRPVEPAPVPQEDAFTPSWDRSAGIIAKIGLSSATAEAVRAIDERWDGTGQPGRWLGHRIPMLARIAAIAQHLDVFASDKGPDNAIAVMRTRSGKWFDPDLVKVAASLHRDQTLWRGCLDILPEAETRAAVLELEPRAGLKLGPERIDRICEAFSDVVDAKSPFTVVHSLGVADSAMMIAETMGLSAKRTQFVRRAALLHDLGKLRIPTAVLEKQGKLTAEEFMLVKQHPALTKKILNRIPAFRELAQVAGSHHEKLDGTGYPNNLRSEDLSIETRIIAVADVYTALSEERPYRESLDLAQITAIMSKDIPGKLDPQSFEALLSALKMDRATA
ncbi:putative nucleotidyltransferase with HDIG domain [Granulicella aggregans]|uniref:Putative nucleotidyltransferase with HDIG domain n=1 Tax=Granulicella aggregans TaxID=474949 RepID=A0A7W8E4R1_9BACT|nr:HD domain-containing protein [Granulicella aggregans]MBB5058519.1 putative nucleotidyltransferase with HDIG domain [Granulicella aggregans]